MSSISASITTIGVALLSLLSGQSTDFKTQINNITPNLVEETIIINDIGSDDLGENIVIYDNSDDTSGNIMMLEETTQNVLKVEPVANSGDSTMPYYVKVNIAQNVVNIYKKDENGDYSIPEKVILCSTGTYTPKPGKKYKLTSYRRTWNSMQGGVYAQYAVQVTGNILMHSVPFLKKNNSTLEYWEYDKLGTKASLGCIRMNTADARWIYNNVWAGTTVEFYEDENPGPLGKPEGIKISDNIECRNWDPTDYVEGNPWHAEG